jgi:hypothetical protein
MTMAPLYFSFVSSERGGVGTTMPSARHWRSSCDITLICWPRLSRYDSGTPVTRAIST